MQNAVSQDIPLFIYQCRTDSKAMHDIIVKFKRKGLSDANVQKWVQEYAYEKLLPHVWAERDREKRLVWLRENAKWHVPLMFELAMAEMKYCTSLPQEDIASYYHANILPLLEVALLRVRQDIHANPQDPSLQGVYGLMHNCYSHASIHIIQTANLPSELLATTDTHHAMSFEKKRDLIQKLIHENQSQTPPPIWLKGHGMANHTQGMLNMFSPQSPSSLADRAPLTVNEIHEVRLHVAQESLREMEPAVRPRGSC